MRSRTYVNIPVFLLAGLCVSSAQGQPSASELELIQLNDDIYVIHNEGVPGNATALITDEGVLLIDDKFEVDYDNIVRLLRSVTDQPVRYVVNTHSHGDHSGSNARFQAAGADVVATEHARARMAELNQAGLPRFTMEESARIHIGGHVVDLMYLGRGHTGGDLVVYFPEYQILAAGDLYANGLPALFDYAAGGSAREWTNTLDKILMLGFETVIPGHGPVTTKAGMREFRDNTFALRTHVQELLRQGSSREEIEAVLRNEYGWQEIHLNRGLDGLLGELR